MVTYENFSEIRDREGLTNYRVAKLSGVPESTLSRWKSGQGEPEFRSMNKIAGALNVDVMSLYRGYETD